MLSSSTISLPMLRPIETGDLDAVHALSVEAGWPHRPDDWRLVHRIGRGVVAADEGGRIMGSAMWWPFGSDVATIGMVLVSPRLQGRGTGRRMMRWIFKAAGTRTLRLVATAAGQRLYESEGFHPSDLVMQHQGIVPAHACVRDDRVRPVRPDDAPGIAALDAEAFGADRRVLVDALTRVGDVQVLEENGRTTGFSICRPFGRGHVVGPLVAGSVEAAVALAGAHVATQAGSFLRIDTSERDNDFTRFLEASGLFGVDRVVQMTRGTPPRTGPAKIFALANQALG